MCEYPLFIERERIQGSFSHKSLAKGEGNSWMRLSSSSASLSLRRPSSSRKPLLLKNDMCCGERVRFIGNTISPWKIRNHELIRLFFR